MQILIGKSQHACVSIIYLFIGKITAQYRAFAQMQPRMARRAGLNTNISRLNHFFV